jgi:(p)ppGpp synthase/HD superfamily hydrolase
MNNVFEKALMIAIQAHSGQTDKQGKPYILHPLAVASQLDSLELKTIALLHDTIEDSWVTEEFLLENGIPEELVEVIALLTKPKDMTYEDYLRRVKTNPMALAVKKADLAHNTSPERAGGLNDHRRAKYELAKRILSE